MRYSSVLSHKHWMHQNIIDDLQGSSTTIETRENDEEIVTASCTLYH